MKQTFPNECCQEIPSGWNAGTKRHGRQMNESEEPNQPNAVTLVETPGLKFCWADPH